MHKFKYVPKDVWQYEFENISVMINEVRDIVRKKFTFTHVFTGMSSRNLVSTDSEQKIGYDFDIDICVNDENENFSAEDLKIILMSAFNEICNNYDYSPCINSTNVFTLKSNDNPDVDIKHNCDFSIIYNCEDGTQQFVKNRISKGIYYWEYKSMTYYDSLEKEVKLKKNNLWAEVRKRYFIKKNSNKEILKKSKAIFKETINEVTMKHFE